MTATAKENRAIENGRGWYATIEELLERHDKAADAYGEETEDAESVIQEIQEGPLSILVRDGWRTPGGFPSGGPDEYEILLATGGPALRIHGTLDEHAQPATAELQWQDWFKPWERCTFAKEETLLRYASYFYFGS